MRLVRDPELAPADIDVALENCDSPAMMHHVPDRLPDGDYPFIDSEYPLAEMTMTEASPELEQLFRRLERRVVDVRLRSGFMAGEGADVDGFLSFSLSVQNRRKSRAGQALENHLEAMFRAHGLRFARGAETENRNKPDFLFPGQAEYRDPAFPAQRLTMLGAKSSLKDRWRQVLSEAARIETKHLLTLEPGISANQTDEMQAKRLQLVIPSAIHASYADKQRGWLMGVSEFIQLVRSNQF